MAKIDEQIDPLLISAASGRTRYSGSSLVRASISAMSAWICAGVHAA